MRRRTSQDAQHRSVQSSSRYETVSEWRKHIYGYFQSVSDSDELGSKARVEEEGRSPCIDRYTVLSTHTDTTHAEREREREREGERGRERVLGGQHFVG